MRACDEISGIPPVHHQVEFHRHPVQVKVDAIIHITHWRGGYDNCLVCRDVYGARPEESFGTDRRGAGQETAADDRHLYRPPSDSLGYAHNERPMELAF